MGIVSARTSVLTINGGSSSIKFAVHRADQPAERWLRGKIERIGLSGTKLTSGGEFPVDRPPVAFLLDWLEQRIPLETLAGVGHRVVHGMRHTDPCVVTPKLLEELRRIRPFDPEHLPLEIELIEAFAERYPHLPQVACFDTAFHSAMPRVARLLPIPRRFDAMGIQRYGFHGISYSYLMETLAHLQSAQGRVILAHLGNGASLAAVRDGRSVDTSMGFTAASGLPMGTRSGDLDPGVAWYLTQAENLTPQQFNHLIHHDCGLVGISETSSDMRDLLERQASDARAAEAVELFCYQARKWVGAYAAALGGLDTLVFSGGIGENCAEVRSRVCRDLQFLGIELDSAANAIHASVISTGRVTVRVIRTDEELMIAREVCRRIKERQDG